MIDVGIAALANQELTIQLDERFYIISLRDVGGTSASTITREGVTLVSGLRITPGTPMLPYRYQEAGNFLLLTDADALPDYTQFGVTQFLVYLTEAELAEYRS
jgi:hypothetical protein